MRLRALETLSNFSKHPNPIYFIHLRALATKTPGVGVLPAQKNRAGGSAASCPPLEGAPMLLGALGETRYNRTHMIGLLRGQLAEKHPNQVLLDVGGVGYVVFIPLSTFYALGDLRSETTLIIHTHVREDALSLYGFLTAREKHLFELLISASGVGPSLALKILSGMSTDDLVPAIRAGDLPKLTLIPGVGRKTAERIVLELRDKLSAVEVPVPEIADAMGRTQLEADVISALDNLGYDRRAAEKAVAAAVSGADNANFEAVLRATLQQLSAPSPKGARRSA